MRRLFVLVFRLTNWRLLIRRALLMVALLARITAGSMLSRLLRKTQLESRNFIQSGGRLRYLTNLKMLGLVLNVLCVVLR